MNKIFTLILMFTSLQWAYAQETNDQKQKLNTSFYGFIKSDFWYDSRQMLIAREGLYEMMPLDVNYDVNGKDKNATGSFNYTAISSRAGVKFGGIDAFGAKVTGVLEGGFTGASNATVNNLRLRQAFIKFNWKKSELLAGQYWHPMFVTSVFPIVASLNTGSPFQPFNRSPQLRLTYSFTNIKIIAAALSQRDYVSSGPLGKSYLYLSESKIPNLHFQTQYLKNGHTLGLAADFKALKPRQTSDSNIVVDEKISSISFMAFYKYTRPNIEFKAKAIYGQNLTDHLMIGGYAVQSIDASNDTRTYTPTQHLFGWASLLYHKQFEKFELIPTIYFGYAQNIGTLENNTGIYYATGSNIDYMYRFTPSISFKSGSTMLSFEYEYTNVLYGDIQKDGMVTNTHAVANHRFLTTIFYFF